MRSLVLVILLYCSSVQAASLQLVTEIFPPYQQLDQNGRLTGWSAALVEQLFAQAGLPYQPQVLPWPRALKMAQTQPNTVIFSLLQTDARLAEFRWLVPLCPMRVSFYTSANRSDVNPVNLVQARRFIVGVEQGHANYKFLRDNGFRESKNLVVVGQNHQLNNMLALKRVDLILASENYVAQLKVAPGAVPLRKVFTVEALQRTLFLAAHKKTAVELTQVLLQAYQQLKQQGRFQCPPQDSATAQ
ncbi:ABC transporter substrate-binding protein [Rheinheimera sp. 4Y26]|uniref:substrate-binding periplasmic protein n=1 Tax=Rheinheimera sp. 4Y26 TaxID=2977811 RepID=UPI0021B13191|nr:transporter substrate-binding domain-containing protein [Rheinheimera sp. 4Y26]MCT6698089.1 transporter substrate-binding domain-containing protein [Rheinheimera sp. 4Y26]